MQSSKEQQGEIKNPHGSMQRKRGKQQNGKDLNLFNKIRDYQGTISREDGKNKGQKWQRPNRRGRD